MEVVIEISDEQIERLCRHIPFSTTIEIDNDRYEVSIYYETLLGTIDGVSCRTRYLVGRRCFETIVSFRELDSWPKKANVIGKYKDHTLTFTRVSPVVEEPKEVPYEYINHPSHYNQPGRKECIEEMLDIWGPEAVRLWCEMTAYRYSYRMGNKKGEPDSRDAGKRDWYLNKAKELKEKIDPVVRLY